MSKAKVTILNSMAGKDFEQALDKHVSWNIELLDLKDAIFGKEIVELTEDEAKTAAELIDKNDLAVYCLSTSLFHGAIELGEERFRKDYLRNIGHIINLANTFKPSIIRLLSAQTSKSREGPGGSSEIKNSIKYIRANHPWLIPLYVEAIDRLYQAGYKVTIENEVGNCIFANPEEIVDFFEELDCPEKVCFTWDVQNLWQMGTYPTMEVYNKLKQLIGYYHLKGGQSCSDSNNLCWKSSLKDASWPVVEITRQVVIDGVSQVICLNPSHGRAKEGYDYSNITKRDLDFIRREIPEVE